MHKPSINCVEDGEIKSEWKTDQCGAVTHTHMHSLTLCVYCRHIAPAVSLDNIHHGFGLLHIWWHHSHEIFIQALLAGIYMFRSLAVDFWCFCVRRSTYQLLNHLYYIRSFIRVHKSCSLLASNQHVFLGVFWDIKIIPLMFLLSLLLAVLCLQDDCKSGYFQVHSKVLKRWNITLLEQKLNSILQSDSEQSCLKFSVNIFGTFELLLLLFDLTLSLRSMLVAE